MNYLTINESVFDTYFLLFEPKIVAPRINKCIGLIKEFKLKEILWFDSEHQDDFDWDIKDVLNSEVNRETYNMTILYTLEVSPVLSRREISLILDKVT